MTLPALMAQSLEALAVDKPQDETTTLDTVVVSGKKPVAKPLTRTDINASDVQKQRAVQDTAKLLEDIPGVSLQSAGGVSSLPIIHGLNDERVKVEVNGMNITSACANHMNPPLSYIDPSNVGKISVLKGITPVSMGGDSIGGTISVQSLDPVFAKAGEAYLLNGRLSGFYKSNGDVFGGAVTVGAANQFAKFEYTGSYSQASRDYKDGNNDVISSTRYANENHAIALAFKHENHLLEIKGGLQHIPFQGFPTQRMDMTNNDSIFGNVHYKGTFDWGNFDGRLYLENTSHAMDITDDRFYAKGYRAPSGRMPMDTSGRNLGYKLQAELPFGDNHLVRIGNEFVSNRINEWWPAVPGSGAMMGGTTGIAFINLNNASRDRIGTYAEWEAKWTPELSSMLGVRYDHTMTSAGNVHGYTSVISGTAALFDKSDRNRNFDSVDITASLHYTLNKMSQFEFGYAMKNRAPSLYELYPWSNSGMMMSMIGSAGDGNGYIGNDHLKKETAHNLSFTAAFQDPANNAWDFKASPYFSYVENYIDANRCATGAASSTSSAATACIVSSQPTLAKTSATPLVPNTGFSFLQYANHDAILYGVDVNGRADLYKHETAGQFSTHTNMSYVRGKRTDGTNLYHMMPFNMKLSLDHQLSSWKSNFEMQFVDSKTDVQWIRNELKTPSYILLNAKTSYQWKKLTLNVGVDNILNKQYYSPTGGSYMGNNYTMSIGSAGGVNTNLPGMGRSVFVGFTLEY